MKYVRCSECGTELSITRKALPLYGVIVDVIPPHVCPKEPVPYNPKPDPLPVEDVGQFMQNLNDLASAKAEGSVLQDRRPPEQIKTTIAPKSILDQLNDLKKG